MADNVKVNNTMYAWASVESTDMGYGVMEGVQEIGWELKRDSKPRYGRGSEPRGMALGNKEYSGQIVMDLDEYYDQFLPWVLKQPDVKDPTDLEPFSLEVSKKRHSKDTLNTTRLTGVRFTGDQTSISQGATDWNVTLPFVATGKEEKGVG